MQHMYYTDSRYCTTKPTESMLHQNQKRTPTPPTAKRETRKNQLPFFFLLHSSTYPFTLHTFIPDSIRPHITLHPPDPVSNPFQRIPHNPFISSPSSLSLFAPYPPATYSIHPALPCHPFPSHHPIPPIPSRLASDKSRTALHFQHAQYAQVRIVLRAHHVVGHVASRDVGDWAGR